MTPDPNNYCPHCKQLHWDYDDALDCANNNCAPQMSGIEEQHAGIDSINALLKHSTDYRLVVLCTDLSPERWVASICDQSRTAISIKCPDGMARTLMGFGENIAASIAMLDRLCHKAGFGYV